MITLVALAALLAGESSQGSPASSPDQAAAQAAEEAGRLAEAFRLYVQALQALPDPPPPEVDLRLRERIVRLAPRLDPPPEVPEDAERHAVRGRVLFGDAHDAADFEASAAEFRKAVRLAPFLTTAAFNLALVQEKLEQYDLALGNMRLHLLAVVDPAEAQQVRAKVYELELRHERAAQSREALGGKVFVAMETTFGRITLALDPVRAPITVENFLAYVRAGHYDGTIFHRVIRGGIAQGGGFDPQMKERPTRKAIRNESTNGLTNRRGTIAMARFTKDPDSATAQFFINLWDQRLNDGTPKRPGFAVFGEVIEGLDVVERIAASATGRRGPYREVPEPLVVITSARVVSEPPRVR